MVVVKLYNVKLNIGFHLCFSIFLNMFCNVLCGLSLYALSLQDPITSLQLKSSLDKNACLPYCIIIYIATPHENVLFVCLMSCLLHTIQKHYSVSRCITLLSHCFSESHIPLADKLEIDSRVRKDKRVPFLPQCLRQHHNSEGL